MSQLSVAGFALVRLSVVTSCAKKDAGMTSAGICLQERQCMRVFVCTRVGACTGREGGGGWGLETTPREKKRHSPLRQAFAADSERKTAWRKSDGDK